MSMHRKYPIAVDRLQNEIRDLARVCMCTILVGCFTQFAIKSLIQRVNENTKMKWELNQKKRRKRLSCVCARITYADGILHRTLPLQRIYIDLSRLEKAKLVVCRQGIFLFKSQLPMCVCEPEHECNNVCTDMCANLTIKKRSALCRTSFIPCIFFYQALAVVAVLIVVVFCLYFGFIQVSFVFRGLFRSCALWTRIILA